MMRFIPAEARPYRTTADFTRSTVPGALRNGHSTKAGVWALIHVTLGRLLYVICDPAGVPRTMELSGQSGPGVVLPQERHYVEIIDDVEFHVEFFSVPDKPVDGPIGTTMASFAEVLA
jgi:tellurite resistance-related uncharacterized protein